MLKILKWLGLVILVVIIAVVGYLGFSYYQLTRTQVKDLGVRYTPADYAKAVKDKAKVDVPVPSDVYFGADIRTEGSHKIDQTLTNAEFSAMENTFNEKNGPFRDVQIKFDGNNTMEASFYVMDPRVPKTGPVYVKSTVAQTGPKSFDMPDVQEVRVGDWKVPAPIVSQAKTEFLNYVNGKLGQVNGLNVQNIDIQNGQLHFVGSVPDKVTAN